MTSSIRQLLAASTLAAGATAAGYVGLVTGACPWTLGSAGGRAPRPPAPGGGRPREAVFDLIAEPYLGQAPTRAAGRGQAPPEAR